MSVVANAAFLRCTLVVLTLGAVAPSHAQPTAEKPAVQVGDAWTYTLTTDTGRETKEVTFTRKVAAVGTDGGMDIQIGERINKHDAAGNYLDPRGGEYNRMLYKFPMQVGSAWSYTAKFGTQVAIEQHGAHKVVAYEPLTVPAGTFDCYKVEGKAEAAYKASYQQQVRETYWYCPKVNGIAKVLRETSTMSRDTPSSREKVEQVLVKYAPKG